MDAPGNKYSYPGRSGRYRNSLNDKNFTEREAEIAGVEAADANPRRAHPLGPGVVSEVGIRVGEARHVAPFQQVAASRAVGGCQDRQQLVRMQVIAYIAYIIIM